MAWRLAVSTLGMPGAGVECIAELARRHGCSGVELRSHPEEAVHPGLSAAERARVRAVLSDAGLTVLNVASYVRIAAPGDDASVLSELAAQLDLAHDLGAASVRVFPRGDVAAPAASDARAARRLAAIDERARARGVRVLLETHDSHPRGADVARVLDAAACGAGAIWDVLHPWRQGEDPASTLHALAPHLGYVQLKDAAAGGERPEPALPGRGAVPLGDVAAALEIAGYDGWVSLEWERRWHPQIAPLEVALEALRAWGGERLANHPA